MNELHPIGGMVGSLPLTPQSSADKVVPLDRKGIIKSPLEDDFLEPLKMNESTSTGPIAPLKMNESSSSTGPVDPVKMDESTSTSPVGPLKMSESAFTGPIDPLKMNESTFVSFLSSDVPNYSLDNLTLCLNSAIEEPSHNNDIRKLVFCLHACLHNEEAKKMILGQLDQVWGILFLQVTTCKDNAILGLGLECFACIIRQVSFSETLLIKIVMNLMRPLTSNGLSPLLQAPIVDILVYSSRNSEAVRNLIFDEVTFKDINEYPCPQSWFAEFIFRDILYRLQNYPLEDAHGFDVGLLLDRFDSLVAVNHETILKLGWMEFLIEELGQRMLLPEWLPLTIVGKHYYSLFLKTLTLKTLKVEVKLKLMDILGNIVSPIRKCELRATSHLSPDHLFDHFSKGKPLKMFDRRRIFTMIQRRYHSSDDQCLLDGNPTYEEVLGAFFKFSPELGPSSEKFLGYLLQCVSDVAPSVRSKSLKTMAKIMNNADPLASNENFLLTVTKRIEDHSPLVREAAIDLVMDLVSKPMSSEILSLILSKISDSSISVRKKCVRIALDLLRTIDCNDTLASEVKAALISESTSGIKSSADMAYTGIIDGWIRPIIEVFEDSNKMCGNNVWRPTLAWFTADIIRIIRSKNMSFDMLKLFFTKTTCDVNIGSSIVKISDKVVDLLVETLANAVEESNDTVVKFILAALTAIIGDRSVGLQKHFRLLCSLILSDDGQTVEHALRLIHLCLQDNDNLVYRQVPEFCSNLLKLSFRGSENIIRGSLLCLFDIARTCQPVKSQIFLMLDKIVKFTRQKKSVTEDEVVHLLSRSILCACHIARLGHELSFGWGNTYSRAVGILSDAKLSPHDNVKVFCNVGIADLIVGDPLSSLQDPLRGYIMQGLLEDGETSVLALLKGFHEILRKDKETGNGSKFDIDATPNVDYASSLSTVFQEFIIPIKDSAIRFSDPAIVESNGMLLASILKQGISHPQVILPYILRLWRCPWPDVAVRLNDVCTEIVETYESYVSTSLCKVIRLSYEWSLHLNPEIKGHIPEGDGEDSSYFKPLYEALRTKTRRSELICSLLKELSGSSLHDIQYGIFLAEALGEMPYKTIDEVAIVIKRVSDLIVTFDDEIGHELPGLCRQFILLRLRSHLSHCYRMTNLYI